MNEILLKIYIEFLIIFNLLIIMVIVAFLGLGLTITLAVIMGGNATNIFDIAKDVVLVIKIAINTWPILWAIAPIILQIQMFSKLKNFLLIIIAR